MKSEKLENLGLNFEKVTISRLKQTSVNGGANNANAGANIAVSKHTERGETCWCTWCEVHEC